MDTVPEADRIYFFPSGCSFEYLHGKSVQFEINSAEVFVSGFGFFRVLERESGEQSVEIVATMEQFEGTRATHVIRLVHDYVSWIRPHANPALADYECIDRR